MWHITRVANPDDLLDISIGAGGAKRPEPRASGKSDNEILLTDTWCFGMISYETCLLSYMFFVEVIPVLHIISCFHIRWFSLPRALSRNIICRHDSRFAYHFSFPNSFYQTSPILQITHYYVKVITALHIISCFQIHCSSSFAHKMSFIIRALHICNVTG